MPVPIVPNADSLVVSGENDVVVGDCPCTPALVDCCDCDNSNDDNGNGSDDDDDDTVAAALLSFMSSWLCPYLGLLCPL
ncbi:hypothetical protein O1611_g6266 [Lasiodiplodia mahajangana]|uniref:Uncharacterized protein n=1 Tax=Lasiodiplodia mahajangana TaxID=1108764 RepID=A0ACC2JIL9_9PEZI|nr:hypothetical protein O1611_g6266 [Lasiodiplodia mahajangana]